MTPMPNDKDKIYKTGNRAPVSGIYDVLHKDLPLENHQVTCIKKDKFPPCRDCGHDVTFRLFKAALHFNEDERLKDGAWRNPADSLSMQKKKKRQ